MLFGRAYFFPKLKSNLYCMNIYSLPVNYDIINFKSCMTPLQNNIFINLFRDSDGQSNNIGQNAA